MSKAKTSPEQKAFSHKLTLACSSDMLGLFKKKTGLYNQLKTNAVTFKAVSDPEGEGAKRDTVESIVKNFFEVLRNQSLKSFPGDADTYGFVAANLYARYASDITEMSYGKCISSGVAPSVEQTSR